MSIMVAAVLLVNDGQRGELRRMATSSSLPHRQVVQARAPDRIRIHTSVDDLKQAIATWADHWNTDPKPFIWKATAEDIIAKVPRGRATLHQINTQTDH
jgi:hypothetical protein